MRKLFVIFSLLILINSVSTGQVLEKIDYYVTDTLLSSWAEKINNAIKLKLLSNDTIELGSDTFINWDIKTNNFIKTYTNDTIIYGVNTFEDKRLKFNAAIDLANTTTISCDSIVPCGAIIPCDAEYTSYLYESKYLLINNLSKYYKHEENLII